MARLSVFGSPLLLGFARIEQLLEQAVKTSADGYPPYNIEQTAPDRLRITLAVAGFSEADLELSVADNQLSVVGHQADNARERYFLHRGIAARRFQRSFILADGVQVITATLDNGLLHIDLVLPLEANAPRRINIERGEEAPRTLGLSRDV